MDLQEKDIQKLIAQYPWLLSQNFEAVPGLRNQGMEYGVGGQRIDLVLRDRITKRPIIIEFKSKPFYRDNIGQIAEYRGRIVLLLAGESTALKDVFGNLLSCPILCLVVPSCDEISRVACAISGIDVYEYGSELHTLLKPDAILSLEGFASAVKNTPLPLGIDRWIKIDEVYKRIHSILESQQLQQYWIAFGKPRGEYYDCLSHAFINKWLFRDAEISVGIYEPVFENPNLSKVCIEFASETKKSLDDFLKGMGELPSVIFGTPVQSDDGEYGGYYLSFHVSIESFLDKLEDMLQSVIIAYKKGMESIGKTL